MLRCFLVSTKESDCRRQAGKNRLSGQNQLSLSRMYKKTSIFTDEIFMYSCRNTTKIRSRYV